MKNLYTDRTVYGQTADESHKKPPQLSIFVLCIFLAVSIIVTTILLGINLSRFSDKGSNVIALAPSNNVGSEYAADGNTNIQSDSYHGELLVQDDVQTWSTETNVDLFKESYGDTVQSDDGDKRIAPGTSNYYDFTLKNNGNIPLDYSVALKIENHLKDQTVEAEIPLEWRLLADDGTIISDWQEYNEKTKVLKQDTLDVRHRDRYTIEWRWIFERGQEMDIEDTGLGNLSVNQEIGVNATIYVQAEQSADWDGKKPLLPHTGDDFNPVLYLSILVISICVLLILIVVYKRRKKGEDVQDDQK